MPEPIEDVEHSFVTVATFVPGSATTYWRTQSCRTHAGQASARE
jgi:hypothetical protein